MIAEKIKKLLAKEEFVYIATSNLESRPNVAPKFLIRIDKSFIYLLDYVIGRTWANIKINPRASISFIDNENLTGYQVNGSAELITAGEEFNAIIKDLQGKKDALTVQRVIEGIQRGKGHDHSQLTLPEKGLVIKIKVEEVVEIGPSGKLQREKI